jgi:hypothetical protein
VCVLYVCCVCVCVYVCVCVFGWKPPWHFDKKKH